MEKVEHYSPEADLAEHVMDDLFPVEHSAEQVAEELRTILFLPLETSEQQHLARKRILMFTELHTQWSPSFFNALPLEEKLSLLRATYRHPLANRYLYQSFSGELGYEVTFYGEQFRAAVFDTAKDPLSRCENVSVYLHLAARDEGYNERAQRAMRQALQRLANEGSPLERIVATAALFRLERSAHDDRRLLPAETARELLHNIEQNHRDDIARTERYTVENPLEEERDLRAIAADALATFSNDALSRITPHLEIRQDVLQGRTVQQFWLQFQKTHTLGDFFDCLHALNESYPEVTPPLVHEALTAWRNFQQDKHRYQADLERVLNADNNLLYRTLPKIITALPRTTPQTAVTFSAPQRVLASQQADHALRALAILHEPFTRAALELEFDNTFKLSDLRLREQEQLLPYLLGTNEAQFAAAKEYTKRFGLPYLKTFLALEGNAVTLERIHTVLDEHQENAPVILRAFGTLSDLAQESASSLHDRALHENSDHHDWQGIGEGIRRNLLQRATDIFQADDAVSIARRLTDLGSSSILFAAACKALKNQQGAVNLEYLRDFSLTTTEHRDLSDDDRRALIALWETNWQGKDGSEIARSEFLQALEGSKGPTTWYRMYAGNTLLGCMYFRQDPDFGQDAKYCGGFNTLPEFQANGIGAAAVHAILTKERQQGTLHAYGSIDLPVGTLQLYTKELGMRIVDLDGEWLHLYLPQANRLPKVEKPEKTAGSLSLTKHVRLSPLAQLSSAIRDALEANMVVTGITRGPNNTVAFETHPRQLAA